MLLCDCYVLRLSGHYHLFACCLEQEDEISWFERGNNVLVISVVALALLWAIGSSFADNLGKQQYEQAVETKNYALVRCFDTALGPSEKNMCMMKYK